MLTWVEYKEIRRKYFGERRVEARANYNWYLMFHRSREGSMNKTFNYKKAINNMLDVPVCEVSVCAFETAPNPKTILEVCTKIRNQQEGKTPMSYEKSDTATQRDYLLQRLAYASSYDRVRKFRAIFNMDVNNVPKTYKELIDFVKNDKFTLDTKRTAVIDANLADDSEDANQWFLTGPFDGIIWNGPQPDKKGYEQATKDDDKQFTMAKDIIMTGTAAEGLKALQAFEAWTPTPTATA